MEINTDHWITLKQAVELTGQNARFIQRKQLQGLIDGLDVWGLNHRLYSKEQVLIFIKKETNDK